MIRDLWEWIIIFFKKHKPKPKMPKTFTCDGCLVKPSCKNPRDCDKIMTDEDELLEFFTNFRCCPDCGSGQFYEGPRGGMAQNMKCCGCGHKFNMGMPLFVQRI